MMMTTQVEDGVFGGRECIRIKPIQRVSMRSNARRWQDMHTLFPGDDVNTAQVPLLGSTLQAMLWVIFSTSNKRSLCKAIDADYEDEDTGQHLVLVHTACFYYHQYSSKSNTWLGLDIHMMVNRTYGDESTLFWFQTGAVSMAVVPTNR
ncbi:predicted protein [Lichtheimia corymbifera JMRC:FSU:9682]|uniref:Uncharacterized protein n=1 Tax=Lichtheimia corymbifera JMRC:FSU:9682 TaxID=1263082 RepID=A0A068S401_9FUNG|nr:predicted protein [Lichtheimia corymbifera JMRC:FSU:9682]